MAFVFFFFKRVILIYATLVVLYNKICTIEQRRLMLEQQQKISPICAAPILMQHFKKTNFFFVLFRAPVTIFKKKKNLFQLAILIYRNLYSFWYLLLASSATNVPVYSKKCLRSCCMTCFTCAQPWIQVPTRCV